jgi:signal transduction histidine kinase
MQNRALENQVSERTQEIERRREVAEGLRDILALINSNRTQKESLDAIILQINRLMETRGAVIFRFGEDNFPIVLASNLPDLSSAAQSRDHPPLPGWITTPVIQGQALKLTDLGAYTKSQPDVSQSIFSQYRTLLAVPLMVNERVDGGLVLLYNYLRELDEDDEKIAANFANHAALAIANAELRSQAEEIAVSAERSRLARDLHDAVTQTLFATSLIAEVLPRLWDRNPVAGKQKIAEIRELTRGALAEMRTLLMELRPKALEDVPLPDLLQQLSEAFTGRARIPVKREVSSTIELPSQVKIGFYRIAQEALNNIQKHSRASFVRIELQEENDQVKLCISDDGIGFDPGKSSPDHFGLGIMEERAQNIKAHFSIDSQSGKGTQIVILWKRSE